MRTSEEIFELLPTIDIEKFLEATMDSRGAYARMDERQKTILRHAIRYGQLQTRAKFKQLTVGQFTNWLAGL